MTSAIAEIQFSKPVLFRITKKIYIAKHGGWRFKPSIPFISKIAHASTAVNVLAFGGYEEPGMLTELKKAQASK